MLLDDDEQRRAHLARCADVANDSVRTISPGIVSPAAHGLSPYNMATVSPESASTSTPAASSGRTTVFRPSGNTARRADHQRSQGS